jgi:CheY-like chemotaxis protein
MQVRTTKIGRLARLLVGAGMNGRAGNPEQRHILLIAADMNERRLLYGQLLESGYDVLPLPGMVRALAALLPHSIQPRLILLDVQGDEAATPQSVEYLKSLAPDIPLIAIVGSIDRELWQPLETGVATLLHRPITVARIVAAVEQILPADAGRDPECGAP